MFWRTEIFQTKAVMLRIDRLPFVLDEYFDPVHVAGAALILCQAQTMRGTRCDTIRLQEQRRYVDR